jgi:hypothetical protein
MYKIYNAKLKTSRRCKRKMIIDKKSVSPSTFEIFDVHLTNSQKISLASFCSSLRLRREIRNLFFCQESFARQSHVIGPQSFVIIE